MGLLELRLDSNQAIISATRLVRSRIGGSEVISRTLSALVLFLSLAAVGSAQTISGTVS